MVLLGVIFIGNSINVYAIEVTLAWDANSEERLAGYRIFSREEGQSYNYDEPTWEGISTTCTLTDVKEKTTYYFVARAFDDFGNESIDSEEVTYVTAEHFPDDIDNDGMPDSWETSYGLNTMLDDSGVDLDEDGLTNLEEYEYGTNPLSFDTDGDGISDESEIQAGTNPKDLDEYPASRYYVAPSPIGDDNAHSGISPTAPFETIQHAINMAYGFKQNPVTIYVAAGIYYENVKLGNWESLHGGWKNDFSQRWDFEQDGLEPTVEYESIIDAQDIDTAIVLGDNTTIDGFSVRNGGDIEGSAWGAIVGQYVNAPTISHNNIYDNYFDNAGAGIFLASCGGTPVIENNLIHHNTSGSLGAGISCRQSSPLIKNNEIYENTNGERGGGISYVSGSLPEIIGNAIFGNMNVGDSGGGIYGDDHGVALIKNNLIYGNMNGGRYGGGLVLGPESYPLVINNTIYGNDGGSIGGGICLQDDTSFPTIKNSIVWNNTDDLYGVDSGMISFSDIGDGDFVGINGNISQAPLFIDPDGPDDIVGNRDDDLHLGSGSPAIDTGDLVERLSYDYNAGDTEISIHENTGVLPGDTIWITDGIHMECDEVVSATVTALYVAHGFTNDYFASDDTYVCGDSSNYSKEPDDSGGRINMGAYGGTAQATSRFHCTGDLNGDRSVDYVDFSILRENWLQTEENIADLNGDRVVNYLDFLVLREHWLETCP